MKNRLKFLISFLVMMCFTLSQIAFAFANPPGKPPFERKEDASIATVDEQTVNHNAEAEENDGDDEEAIEESKDTDKKQKNPGRSEEKGKKGLDIAKQAIRMFKIEKNTIREDLEKQKNELEEAKDILEEQKDKLEEMKGSMEKQYEEAKETGDMERAEQLIQERNRIKEEFDSLKGELKRAREHMKIINRNAYTQEELEKLEELTKELIAENEEIAVLPVESILAKANFIKFDTPPVVKEGRTLIPVRALSEAFDAEVEWIQEEKKVIIKREEIEIILQLDSKIAYVNDTKVSLDVPAEAINQRTIVPLRFILENLGLKVHWDNEAKTIEIEEQEEEPDDDETEGAEGEEQQVE